MNCLVTGNPCGTDTYRRGLWCRCLNCARAVSVPIAFTPASPPELCPDCQRPKAQDASPRSSGCKDGMMYQGKLHHSLCGEITITRLRLELSKAQGELHEAWKDGMGVGYKAGMDVLWIPPPNPYPKPEKKESGDAE